MSGEPSTYLERRVVSQRNWHSNKATWNKRCFYAVEITTLLSGAAIPVVNIWLAGSHGAGLLSGILGGVIVVAVGVGKLFKFQENWLQFRTLAEALEREEELYKSGIAEYSAEAKRERLLVERVESILAGSVLQFIAMHRAAHEGESADKDPPL